MLMLGLAAIMEGPDNDMCTGLKALLSFDSHSKITKCLPNLGASTATLFTGLHCPILHSPHCCQYISYGTNWENLHKYQDILCLVIISFILVTCIFDHVGIL